MAANPVQEHSGLKPEPPRLVERTVKLHVVLVVVVEEQNRWVALERRGSVQTAKQSTEAATSPGEVLGMDL